MEKPDSILPTLGGQNALNIAMALADEGATVVFYKGIPQDMAGMILSEEKQAHFKEMLDALDFHAEGAVKCARVGKGKICLSDDINALMNEANVGAEKMYQAGLQCIRRNSARENITL